METRKSSAARAKTPSGWLQTLIVTGSLAATVVGAGMIDRLESFKANTSDDEVTNPDSVVPELEPIPTVMDPGSVSAVALLPTATPTAESVTNSQSNSSRIIPTDTPTATATATPVLQQQSTRNVPTMRVQRRARSSR